MKMILICRLFAALLGLVMLTGTTHLGFRAGTDSRFIVWFGISAAIAVPLGLTFLGFAVRRVGDGSGRELVGRVSLPVSFHLELAAAWTKEWMTKRQFR